MSYKEDGWGPRWLFKPILQKSSKCAQENDLRQLPSLRLLLWNEACKENCGPFKGSGRRGECSPEPGSKWPGSNPWLC
jgi:hypothetical protein